MKIAVVSNNYPSSSRPYRGAFVYNFVQEICKNNIDVTVLAPEPAHHYLLNKTKKKDFYGKELAQIFRFPYLSFSNKFSYRDFSAVYWGMKSMALSVRFNTQRFRIKADLVYGHFFYSGLATLELAKKLDVPAVLTIGESRIEDHTKYVSHEFIIQLMSRFSGIVAVSQEIKKILINKYNVPESRIKCIPNASDSSLFYPRDRIAMRIKHGLPLDSFIVIFVGHFNEWKGVHRLIGALNLIDNVYGIFLGSGSPLGSNNKILLAKAVANNQVPEYLSAANLFVLPSRNEGSCNAISEALACGLPVVSSDVPAIREQLDEDVSLLTDPLSEESIASAIQTLLKDKPLYDKMCVAALKKAQSYSLRNKTKEMIGYFDEIIRR